MSRLLKADKSTPPDLPNSALTPAYDAGAQVGSFVTGTVINIVDTYDPSKGKK